MIHKLWDNIDFIIKGYQYRKRANKARASGKYGRNLRPIQEVQKETMYRKWIKYLKEKGLYLKYRDDIIWISNENKRKKYRRAFDPMPMILDCCTRNQISEVVNYIDRCFSGTWIKGRNHSLKWREIFTDFECEKDLKKRKEILARKLYHMDAPNVIHHEYKGSYYPKKRLIDTIIDKMLFIKR